MESTLKKGFKRRDTFRVTYSDNNIMWSVAPKSMTHVEEEEIKHVLVLPDSTNVVIEVDAD